MVTGVVIAATLVIGVGIVALIMHKSEVWDPVRELERRRLEAEHDRLRRNCDLENAAYLRGETVFIPPFFEYRPNPPVVSARLT